MTGEVDAEPNILASPACGPRSPITSIGRPRAGHCSSEKVRPKMLKKYDFGMAAQKYMERYADELSPPDENPIPVKNPVTGQIRRATTSEGAGFPVSACRGMSGQVYASVSDRSYRLAVYSVKAPSDMLSLLTALVPCLVALTCESPKAFKT